MRKKNMNNILNVSKQKKVSFLSKKGFCGHVTVFCYRQSLIFSFSYIPTFLKSVLTLVESSCAMVKERNSSTEAVACDYNETTTRRVVEQMPCACAGSWIFFAWGVELPNQMPAGKRETDRPKGKYERTLL